MKKLILFVLSTVLLLALVGCICGSSQTVTHRGELTVAYDVDLTKDLLAYFQANQDCIVTGIKLDEKTDYNKIGDNVTVAVVKDEAIAEKLVAAGWVETENWTNAQKATNAEKFGFIVLLSPKATSGEKETSKLLSDWLVGDGAYETTVTISSGCSGCNCSKKTETRKIRSDALKLYESEEFAALRAN